MSKAVKNIDPWSLVTGAIGKVFGGTTKTGENQLLELFKGQKQKQREFELELNRQFQKRLELELKDLESARDMQKEALKQNDPLAKRFIYYLATLVITGAMVANLLPIFVEIPEANESLVNRAVDFFNYVVAGGVMSFFFGTKTNRNAKNY